MNKYQKGNQMPLDQLNLIRDQQTINARILGLKHARALMYHERYAGVMDAAMLIENAKQIEKYITEGLDSLKKQSALVIQHSMPPEGAFTPGE